MIKHLHCQLKSTLSWIEGWDMGNMLETIS